MIRLLGIALTAAAVLLGSVAVIAAMARTTIDAWGRAYIVEKPDRLPAIDTALVLGTAPFGVRGQNQRTLAWRLDAAADLWHLGMLHRFIVSGIRIGESYDEASIMRDGLVARGVPASAIELDQHGDRTWDSIARARLVFGRRRLLIVSQRDHVARAIFLARHSGIEAWGVAAPGGNEVGLYGWLFGAVVSLGAYVDVLAGPPARAIAAGR